MRNDIMLNRIDVEECIVNLTNYLKFLNNGEDAQEVLRNLYMCQPEDLEDVFGTSDIRDLVLHNSFGFLAKVYNDVLRFRTKINDDRPIKVGDVVTLKILECAGSDVASKIVVTHFTKDEKYFDGFNIDNGSVVKHVPITEYVKVNTSDPINHSILNEILLQIRTTNVACDHQHKRKLSDICKTCTHKTLCSQTHSKADLDELVDKCGAYTRQSKAEEYIQQ